VIADPSKGPGWSDCKMDRTADNSARSGLPDKTTDVTGSTTISSATFNDVLRTDANSDRSKENDACKSAEAMDKFGVMSEEQPGSATK